MKFRIFRGTTNLGRFREGFGRFLGDEILDFLHFYDIFSKRNFKCSVEGQKIAKSADKGLSADGAHPVATGAHPEAEVPLGEI